MKQSRTSHDKISCDESAHMRLLIVVAMCTSFACVVEQAMNGVEFDIVIIVRPACCANVCRSWHVF